MALSPASSHGDSLPDPITTTLRVQLADTDTAAAELGGHVQLGGITVTADPNDPIDSHATTIVSGFAVGDYGPTEIVTASDGSAHILRSLDSDGSQIHNLSQLDSTWRVRDHNGTTVFRIDGDGTIHILTGASIIPDL